MIVPDFFYGRYSQVKTRTEHIVQKLVSGIRFKDIPMTRKTLETSFITSCYINLFTHSDLSEVRSHYHCTLLPALLMDAAGSIDSPEADTLFEDLLQKEWGPLVFADITDNWMGLSLVGDLSRRQRPYLAAVLKHARHYSREEARFTGPNGRAGSFWQANSALQKCLLDLGIQPKRLDAGFGEASFKAMCRELGIQAL